MSVGETTEKRSEQTAAVLFVCLVSSFSTLWYSILSMLHFFTYINALIVNTPPAPLLIIFPIFHVSFFKSASPARWYFPDLAPLSSPASHLRVAASNLSFIAFSVTKIAIERDAGSWSSLPSQSSIMALSWLCWWLPLPWILQRATKRSDSPINQYT